MKTKLQFSQKKYRKALTCAVLAAVCMASGIGSEAFAATKTEPITGQITDQTTYGTRNVAEQDGKIVYKLYGKTEITPNKTNVPPISIKGTKPVSITTTGPLILNAEKSTHGAAILVGDNKNLTIEVQNRSAQAKNALDITMHSLDYSANGIAIVREGTGEGLRSDVTIIGNVTMRDAKNEKEPWAITASRLDGGVDNYQGARWEPAGISLGQSHGSTLTLDGTMNGVKPGGPSFGHGTIDIAVKGSAIVTDPYYKSTGIEDQTKLAILTLKNANINIETPKDSSYPFYSVANYGGTININAEADASDKDTVNILGNMIVMKDSDNKGGEYFFRSGVINVGLLNANSSWSGVLDNAGTNLTGDLNLTMKNGARWYHDDMSKVDGMNKSKMPIPSINHYGHYDKVTHVNQLMAGNEAALGDMARIYQKNVAPISIQKFSGKAVVMYSHENGGMQAADYKAGKVEVVSAAPASELAVVTDTDGFDLSNKEQAKQVLDQLAHKVYYLGAIGDKEHNLTTTAQILEGLTSPALRSIYHSDVMFDKTTGEGSIDGSKGDTAVKEGDVKPEDAVADHQNKFTYEGGVITGDVNKDKEMLRTGITKDGETYTFSKDTSFVMQGDKNTGLRVIDIDRDITHGVTVAGENATLSMTGTGDKGMAAVYVDSLTNPAKAPIQLQTKAMDIHLSSEKSRQEGFHFKNEGSTKQTVTVDSTTTMDIKGKSAIGVYAYGSNDVTFNKPLSVTVDGLNGGWQNMGAHGIYASGKMGTEKLESPNIHLKDGYTMTGNANGLWANTGAASIDIQGDTKITVNATSNPYYAAVAQLGSVSINYKNVFGKVSAAGKEVQIKGNVGTDRSADYKNWESPEQPDKARQSIINLGLNTPTSFWHGVALNKATEKSIQKGYVDQINVVLQQGATWENAMDWNESIVENLNDEYVGSHLHSLVGGLTADVAGVIVQKEKTPITVDELSGHVKVLYAHDATNPAMIQAGDFVVTKAIQTIDKGNKLNAGVTVATDSDGITMTDTAAVDKVLDALAHKLVYQNYVNKERFLDANVMIAEGLTASSQSKAVGDVFFDKKEGRGYYATDVVEDPTDIPEKQVFSKMSQALAGTVAHDTKYKYAGIMKEDSSGAPKYNFIKDTSITAAEAYKENKNEGKEWHSGIYRNDILKVEVESEDAWGESSTEEKELPTILNLGRHTLTVNTTAADNVAGIGVFNGGQVTFKEAGDVFVNIGHTGDAGDVVGIAVGGKDTSLEIDNGKVIGFNQSKKTTIHAEENIKGLTGILAENGGTFTTKGEIDIQTDKEGHAIHAKGSTVKISGGGRVDSKDGVAILNEDKGTVWLNVFGSGSYSNISAVSTDLVLNGDIVTKGGKTVVGLSLDHGKSNSVWHGGALTTDGGTLDLMLQKGAQWYHDTKNPAITETTISTLNDKMATQESDTGYIWQQSDKDIHVKTYQGNTTVFYAHDAATPTTIKGGNFIIDTVKGTAKGHPSITLVTDNTNVTKTNLNDVFNALAGKLIWTNVDNTIDLNKPIGLGRVQYGLRGILHIAEGLTADAKVKRMGNISFYDDAGEGHVKGQGYLKPIDPTLPIHTSEVLGVDRNVEAVNAVNIENNPRITAMYVDGGHDKTNPMVVDLAGANVSLSAKVDKEHGAVASVVAVDANQALQVVDSDPGENGLTISASSNDTRAVKGIDVRVQGTATIEVPTTIKNMNTEGMAVVGVDAFGDTSKVHFTKDLTISDLHAAGKRGTSDKDNGNGLSVMGMEALGPNSSITVDGTLTVKDLSGVAVNAGGANSKVTLGGADITVATPTDGKMFYALRAEKGSIDVNVKGTETGIVPGDKKVVIVGDMTASSVYGSRVAEYSGGQLAPFTNTATINMGLNTKDSKWDGSALYSKKLVDLSKVKQADDSDGVVDISHLDELKAQTQGGAGFEKYDPADIHLMVKNGAHWNNEVKNKIIDPTWTGPVIKTLTGGDTLHSAGIISQNDKNPITVDTLSGFTRVNYTHDAETPTTINGGDFIVQHAGDNAHIALVTDRDGVSDTIGDPKGIDKVMEALAKKLHYDNVSAAPEALDATVEIGEGLITPKEVKQGKIQFITDAAKGEVGQGYFAYKDASSIQNKNVEITEDGKAPATTEPGSSETVMMRGVKAAQNEIVLLWRGEQNDLQKRMGDLHMAGNTDDGVWARIYGGQFDADTNDAAFDGTFKAIQVGVDKKVGNAGWRTGVAASYLTTNTSQIVGGTADGRMSSLAVYGTKAGASDEYLDIYAKVSQLKSRFHVVNDSAHALNGEYKATGLTLSAEYGRKLHREHGVYLEPQVELTYGRLPGKTYQATSDYAGNKPLSIEQGAYNTLIGRVGIGIGKTTDTTNVNARLSMYHEFCGNMSTTFAAVGEPTKTVEQDYSKTWFALSAGITHKLNRATYFYANLEKSFGGDLRFDWRGDVGVRMQF